MNKRDHLGNRNRNLAKIDMEKVYRLIDEGLTVKQVAEKIGVSSSTLYRHHNKLQKENASKSDGLPKLYNYTV